jgi:Spy/CpxP family protein refolding chaperone
MKQATRIASTLTLALALAALPALAQPPGAPGGGPGDRGFGPSPQQLRALFDYLDLTPQQAAAARGVFADARTAAEPLVAQVRDLRQQLEDLLAAANPDAAAVGQAVVAAHGVRGQLSDLRARTESDFRALLTPEQVSRFDDFQALRELLRPRHRGHRSGAGGSGAAGSR